MTAAKNWIAVAESKYPWERDALEFVRTSFPGHEPYRAWSNFEFIADDGSINEVDLLVFSPQGFFLVEIKSRPGRLFGDAGTWTWETDGKLATYDNPLLAANLKAKKLRSLLQRQKVCQKKGQLPFLEALVFCSAPGLRCELQGNARTGVCLRDGDAADGSPAQAGIMAALMRRECPGLPLVAKGQLDRPMVKLVSQAMEQAGIRPSQRHRKVGDYVLEQIISEGPGYQDWQATHSQLPESKRRVRLYLVRNGATSDERATIQRAALREFQLLESLQHPGVLRANGLTEHEVGPALIFEHDPQSIRLDHFLAQRRSQLSMDMQLDLVRQIAEVVRFAHDKKVVHRALSPQNLLVTGAAAGPQIKVMNWQVGYRDSTSTTAVSRLVSATSHVDRLVEEAVTAYMAPEAFNESVPLGEHLDVFSLGAIAYHIFSGEPPAANGLELSEKLRATKGLQISSVLNGAGEELQFLIQFSTHPEVVNRIDSVVDFLSCLDSVEAELTAPDHDTVDDPNRAQIGDVLPGNLQVLKRLGQGSCSIALLVERDKQEYVLKVANDPDHNTRIKDEADVLKKLRHANIVEFCQAVEIGDRSAFLMRPAFSDRAEKRIETLGQRVRKEGRLHIDLLQRFGEDLLDVVRFLEEQGIAHRDIKPDNIAVGKVGRGDKLHLVLFDFSLSRMSPDNIRAGTTGYLDPLLPLRKPKPRWDLHAERYAAAITLYELTTGALPKWGDGTSDPSHLDCEITIDAELFDPNLREPLVQFFAKAFRRNPAERYDNAEEMLRAWRHCFEGLDEPGTLSDHEDSTLLREKLDSATFDTAIAELAIGTRATNALDRANILTVEDLLTVPMRRLLRLRGVGNKTRREIGAAVKILRERLGTPEREPASTIDEPGLQEDTIEIGSLSVDLLVQRILRTGSREGETVQQTLQIVLGLAGPVWPSQTEIARTLDVTRARIGQVIAKFQTRWAKESALTKLRDDLAEILDAQGGVMELTEAAEAILVARGSVQDEPLRTRHAKALVRAAVEVERTMAEPRFLVRLENERVLLAQSQELALYASQLGKLADELAAEDPLLPPARVLEQLRQISAPQGTMLSDVRLVRLAAAVSENATVSSRQELYPRNMAPGRALKLSQGALLGLPQLTVEQIRERVAGRYPSAAPLPGRPQLDGLLREAGFDLRWDAASNRGEGCYVSRLSTLTSSRSNSLHRLKTSTGRGEGVEITPEVADARQFEERLQRAIKEGAFLSLLVAPRRYTDAVSSLCKRFPLELVDFEGLFLDALQEVAQQAKVNWELVLKTDATPGQGDWDRLLLLVNRAMARVEQQLVKAEKTMLIIYAGVLARYDRMNLLEHLRDLVGRRDGIPGLWLLVPGSNQAMLDGKAVPLLGSGQRVTIPDGWLKNVHRSSQTSLGTAKGESEPLNR